MSQTISRIIFACAVEGCKHGPELEGGTGITEVAHPTLLDDVDLDLLNKIQAGENPANWEETPRGIVEGHLNGKTVCPVHGRQALGFVIETVTTISTDFIIGEIETNGDDSNFILGEDEGDPDWELSWGNH